MGRTKRMTDEEFLAHVATQPDARAVAIATGYTVSYVEAKVHKLLGLGWKAYGKSPEELAQLRIDDPNAFALSWMEKNDLAAMWGKYQAEEPIPDPTPATIEWWFDKGQEVGWSDAVDYYNVSIEEGDDKTAEMHRAHRDALLMNEGYDRGWAKGYLKCRQPSFDDGISKNANPPPPDNEVFWRAGHHQGMFDGKLLAAERRDTYHNLLDMLPPFNDDWPPIVQVEWLRVLERLTKAEAGRP